MKIAELAELIKEGEKIIKGLEKDGSVRVGRVIARRVGEK